MLKIGITGGIGSGKSTVAQFYEFELNIPVYYSDVRSKTLLQTNRNIIELLKTEFGESIYEDGVLNRNALASIVFNNEERLNKLNSIVHPQVELDFANWCNHHLHRPYIMKEAALLFESGTYKQLDLIYTVAADEQLRLKRTMSRDKATEEQVRSRMSKQLTEEERIKRADGIIYNNDKELLIPQLLKLHQQWIQNKKA
ncbi:MAG: dephospho-CoA kinase [Bacteroidetes bacterium]|nr:dephospho-CoA kinase [Bacteroidota bacterium]